MEGIAGIVVPLATKEDGAWPIFEWGVSHVCSLLHDLGTFCIVLSLTRALFHALDIWDCTPLNIIRRFWGWVLVLLPISGYLFAGFVVPFSYTNDHDLQTKESRTVNSYTAIAYSILRANTISLGVTLLAIAPLFLLVLIRRRRGQLWPSSTASATAIGFFPTLVLMFASMANDMLRFSLNHQPTFVVQFALGLIPEVIVTAIWVTIARHIGICDKEFLSHQEDVRELKLTQWNNEIGNAVTDTQALYSADTQQEAGMKDCVSADQAEENVYFCARYRLQRLYEHFNQYGQQLSSSFIEERDLLVEDAKRNALLISRCLVLAPCEHHSLFGRKFLWGRDRSGLRPCFSSSKTAKLVLEAMRKDEAMKVLKREELEWAVNNIVKIHLG